MEIEINLKIQKNLDSVLFPGYWTDVLNQDVTPNQGYINVTLDGACVVQIQRPEMARLYDEFKDKMLRDQDHLLVDVHLSSFAESEKSLVVKVKTTRATLDQSVTSSDVDLTVNLWPNRNK